MNYELAKELKENGFPNVRLCEREDEHRIADCDYCTQERIPTLSELIEACGDDFECLALSSYPNKIWRAYPTVDSYIKKMKGDCVVDCCGYKIGKTPEEAVAKLWLALNKK